MEQVRSELLGHRDDLDPQTAIVNRFHRIESQGLNGPTCLVGVANDSAVIIDNDMLAKQRSRRVVNRLIALGGVTSRTGVEEIVIFQTLSWKTPAGKKVFDLKRRGTIPLFTTQAEDAAKREFVAQPRPETRRLSIALWSVSPNVRLIGIVERNHASRPLFAKQFIAGQLDQSRMKFSRLRDGQRSDATEEGVDFRL